MDISSFASGISGLMWLAFIGLIFMSFVRTSRGLPGKGSNTALIAVGIVAVLLTAVAQSIVFVEPDERGVVVSALVSGEQGGVRPEPLQGGLNWVVPFFERVQTYPVSKQTYTMSSTASEGQLSGDDSIQARTRDGQIVFVDASVIFEVNERKVVQVHLEWQNSYINDLIRPQVRGIIRDQVAVYNIEDVYSSKRAELTQAISDELEVELEKGGLTLVDFVLRNISFSDEYAQSVEKKQIAEQTAQQAVFVVQQREQEAEQARQVAQGQADSSAIRAEGEARALVIDAQAQADSLLIRTQAEADARLIQSQAEAEALILLGEALANNPDVLTLQYINKLAPNITVMLLPADNPFLFPLPDIGPTTPTPTTTVPSTTPETTP